METNTEKKQKTILVLQGVKKSLVEKFNASYPTVRDALNGKSKSLKSIQIREAAINDFGGMEMKDK